MRLVDASIQYYLHLHLTILPHRHRLQQKSGRMLHLIFLHIAVLHHQNQNHLYINPQQKNSGVSINLHLPESRSQLFDICRDRP
jgi:hypothetical protein